MNFTERIDAVLDQVEGEFNYAVLAEKLVLQASENPEIHAELEEWLWSHAGALITRHMQRFSKASSSRQSLSAQRRQASAFGDAAKWWEEREEAGGLESFQVSFAIDAEDNRVRVGDMTGEHHKYVSAMYQVSAEQSAMLAAFHRQVAAKVKDKKTSDVMTEAQYETLRDSIMRQYAGAAA